MRLRLHFLAVQTFFVYNWNNLVHSIILKLVLQVLSADGSKHLRWTLLSGQDVNDDAASPYNTLSDATLAIAVNMSEAARARGLVVTMVPAQSYFDETSRAFDRSLLHAYPDWHPEFAYHGMNG